MAKKYKILNKQPIIAPKANYLLANKFPYGGRDLVVQFIHSQFGEAVICG